MVPLPPAGDPTPALRSPRFECLHCGVLANQIWEVPTYGLNSYFEVREVDSTSYPSPRQDPDAPKRAGLDKYVERALDKVSTPLTELLDVVRTIGNGAVHLDDEPDEIVVMALNDEDGPEIIELLLGVANNLVDELITRPAATRRLWERLPENLRERRSARKAGD